MTPSMPATEQSSVQDPSTAAYGVEEGIALALKEKEEGKRTPFVEWLARHPHLAGELAAFLADDNRMMSAMAPARHSTSPETGTFVDGLQLGEEIGRGGMGIVYRAYDHKLHREVAVKRLRGDCMGVDSEWARFQFEMEAVASLDHANIVRIYSCGEANGSPYLVMPLMEGGSLAQRLRRAGPDRCLPAKEAAEMIRKIALGVHHAHQRVLLHRDLKPGNVLFDANDQPHIADFGLARRLDSSQSLSGSIAGTAAYMAPEQARGDKGLTIAADIHALGAILYELLTGAPPFGSGDFVATLKRVIEEEALQIRQRRRDVPADLEAICMKCLEKNPGDRYKSADELAVDLDHFLHDEAVSARPPGFWDWLRQMLRTRPHPNYSWQVPLWDGALLLASNSVIFGICHFGGSAAAVWVTNLVTGAAILAVFWWYMLRRLREIPITERHSLVIGVGHTFAQLVLMAATIPFSSEVSAREYLKIYPALIAITGLCSFITGSTNWSRLFPTGLLLMGMAPLVARWPDEAPLLYGAVTAALLWYWTAAKKIYFGSRPVETP